jgi:hypothetical protein
MVLYDLVIKSDDIWATLNEMGKHNCLHFVDTNKDKMSHLQAYAHQVKQL